MTIPQLEELKKKILTMEPEDIRCVAIDLADYVILLKVKLGEISELIMGVDN